jgi:DNA-binding NtrC family response regulator
MKDDTAQGKRIISVGKDSNLLSLRHAVLEIAGYEVWSTTNLSLALAFIRNKRCGILLLCHSLPEDSRKSLIKTFRTWCPRSRVIGVVPKAAAAKVEGVEEVVFDSERAEGLLNAITSEPDKAA